MTRSTLKALCAGLATWLFVGAAGAQADYPSKPIRIVLPIAAGSVTDVVLRAAAQELAPRLGQQLIIDNKPGASGVIGADTCAKAPPDGYTVCAVYHATMSFNPLTIEKLPYDPQKDFVPIARLFFVTEALVVPASLPVANVAELRQHAEKHPKVLNFGTLGEGSLQELMVAWLNQEWKTDIAPIPYKGGGPIATAVAAGEIQIAQMGVGNFLGPMQAGQVKALAVSADRRSRLLPNVPTAAEAGLGGFASRPWWGLAAPVGTPAAVVAKLNSEFARLFREPKFVEFLESRYIEPAPTTPQEFAAFLKSDRESAANLVKIAQGSKR